MNERCTECGYEYDLDEAGSVGPRIASEASELAEVATGTASEPGARRQPDVWSPLEYACHLRDVLLVQRERVLLARRSEHPPRLEPMGRDERVEHDGYSEQAPADVRRQLSDAASMFANVLARMGPADWDRTLIYNYPQPSERSLRWVAVHTLHEVRHHRLDVDRQMGISG